MNRSVVSFVASALFVGLLSAAPAHAALITFVSGNGSDSNDCLTPGTACRQVSFALTQTDATGTVHVLPGEYDTFTIDKSLDILAEPGTATIGNHIATPVPGGGNASILVQADGIVRIRGFHIYNPAGGIVSVDAEVLHVEDCIIVPGGSSFGIDFRTTNTSGELYVSNTIVSGDGSAAGGGIIITPSGSGGAKVVLDNIESKDNAGGILINGTPGTGTNTVTVRNSVSSGAVGYGLVVQDTSGGTTNVTIEGSTFSNNSGAGVRSTGASATIRVRNSTVTGNGNGLLAQSGGKLISNGGNVVRGNTANGAFTATEAQQ